MAFLFKLPCDLSGLHCQVTAYITLTIKVGSNAVIVHEDYIELFYGSIWYPLLAIIEVVNVSLFSIYVQFHSDSKMPLTCGVSLLFETLFAVHSSSFIQHSKDGIVERVRKKGLATRQYGWFVH